MKSGNFKFETLFIGDNKILTYFYPQAKSPCLLFTGKHLYSWSLRLFNVFCTFQGCLLKLDTQHGSAPMYGKCRLHDNKHLKPSYDETYYWRNLRWEGEGFSLHFIFKKRRNSFPLTPSTLSLQIPPISSYFLSVHCYENDIFRTSERIQSI